jgi:hypothetical protein
LPWYYGIAFDLEPVSQTIVVQNDANTISVGYQLIRWQNTSVRGSDVACNNYVSFDLADRIDGEIVSVEWLPSIFISD